MSGRKRRKPGEERAGLSDFEAATAVVFGAYMGLQDGDESLEAERDEDEQNEDEWSEEDELEECQDGDGTAEEEGYEEGGDDWGDDFGW